MGEAVFGPGMELEAVSSACSHWPVPAFITQCVFFQYCGPVDPCSDHLSFPSIVAASDGMLV